MSGIDIGTALGIIGNSPILKNVMGHTVDGLKIPRHLDAGSTPDVQKILGLVMSGGTGALLQSPLGSVLAPLMSALGGAQTSATSSLGVDASYITSAISGVSTSAGNLSALADNLVGYASNAAIPGQLAVVAHMGTLASLGSQAPASLAMSTVLAPVNASALLTNATTTVPAIVVNVLAGSVGILDGAAQITAIQAGIDAVTNGSTGALAASSGATMALCAAQSTIALLVAGSPEVIAAIAAAIRPDMLATVQGIVSAHNATLATAASTQAAAAAAEATVATAFAAAEASAPAT